MSYPFGDLVRGPFRFTDEAIRDAVTVDGPGVYLLCRLAGDSKEPSEVASINAQTVGYTDDLRQHLRELRDRQPIIDGFFFAVERSTANAYDRACRVYHFLDGNQAIRRAPPVLDLVPCPVCRAVHRPPRD